MLGLAHSLFRMFRENSDVVPVSRLKKQGVRQVTVLDWAKMQELLQTAVAEALAKRGVELSPEALRSVNQEARETLARLVEQRDQAEVQRDQAEVQRDQYRDVAKHLEQQRNELQKNIDALCAELGRETDALTVERGRRVTAADVVVDAAGMASFRARLHDELTRMFRGEPAGGSRGDGLIADDVAALAERLLEEQRTRALDAARAEQQSKIEQLERRIAKLKAKLEDSEDVVQRLRSAKNVDPGVESVFKSVQGLDGKDRRAAEKKALLDEIFQLNVELREVIAHSN